MPRSYDEIVKQSEQLADYFEKDFTPDPSISEEEGKVRAAALRRSLAEAELGEAVAAARQAGVPWARIGEAVGTTGEAARQKYRAAHEGRGKTTGSTGVEYEPQGVVGVKNAVKRSATMTRARHSNREARAKDEDSSVGVKR